MGWGMSEFQFLHPEGWKPAKGYANGIAAEGRLVFVAGQVGWTENSEIVSSDFVAQVERALINIVAILKEGGAEPRHLTRMTWFVTDKDAYVTRQREIGEAYRRVVGRHFPAMTLIVVKDLLEEGAKVEIEATAVIPAR
jgi:enamine deaminase RidA (YjgF/YER057c/UK114 family)